MTKINLEFVTHFLTSFIRQEYSKLGFQRAIIGLSGGLDSSVAAHLAARALSPANVIGLIMPYRTTPPQDLEDAREVAERLQLRTQTIDITPMIEAYFQSQPTDNNIQRGNKMARERMAILYDFSARYQALILGTSNKTELLLGYCTIHGDMASAINPLGDLYKTQVRLMARHLGVPARIIHKIPSAGFWPGQTDEAELGMSYEEIDQILYHLVDKRKSKQQLLSLGFPEEKIGRIISLIKASEFKRKPPLIPKLSERTVTHDFLYPYDWDK
ncbi:MAG TPA: NAD+ synthase [Candidatus Aminicenantes bacterium]|nr:NAD+ synthase [Candidatus Aminicenantes bacterium]